MEQIIINVKQATEVSGNINMFCVYRGAQRWFVEERRFNFHPSLPLPFPRRAPAPKFSGLFPLQGKKTKWPLMTPCKQRVTGDKLLKHFPLFFPPPSPSGDTWKVCEVAGWLPPPSSGSSLCHPPQCQGVATLLRPKPTLAVGLQ